MAANYKKIEILDAIKNSSGIISEIARKLNCDWHTAKRYVDKWKETKQAILDETEQVKDKAESQTFTAINNGDMQTVRWFLATKGKDRGYSEKVDIEHSGGVTILHDDIK